MKRIITAIICALMVLSFACVAEYEPYVMFEAGTGLTCDIDIDGIDNVMSFTSKLDEYNDGSFRIEVDGMGFTFDDCCYLIPTVYAARWGSYSMMFFVCEYGPSDDPITYCFMYDMGKLCYTGGIPAAAEDFIISKDGIITAPVRADMIGTWNRSADYKVAFGEYYDEELNGGEYVFSNILCEIPRDVYPMGMIVTLNKDLPLYKTRFDTYCSETLKAGQQVILAASDDCSWLYITDTSRCVKGWVRMVQEDYTDYIYVNSKPVEVDELFTGIIYAD